MLVDTNKEHIAIYGIPPGDDCIDGLFDKDVVPDNLALQDPGSQDTAGPPIKPSIILPIHEWVEHTLLNPYLDSISPDNHEADGNPTEQEPTLETTPGSPTDA
jgi:hypothetical protein